MLLRCCTHYISKSRKCCSGCMIGRVLIPKKSNVKEYYITLQLFSFHMLARWCSKSFKLGFSSIWIEKFQMYKMDLEKAEELEIKLPTSIGSWRKQRSSRKRFTSALSTNLKPSLLWIITNYGKFLRRWEYQTTLPVSWEACMQIKKQQLESDMENWFKIGNVWQGCILSTCLFNLYAKYIMWHAGLDGSQAGI